MPTIAVVGAGPGLGLSVAKVFGSHGFDVALISRSETKLATLVAELADAGVTAAAFPADTSDRDQLTAALEGAVARFGRIDVLEYSPFASLVQNAPQDVTVEDLQQQIDEILLGAVTATRAVLPGMLEAEAGTLLYTVGGGAINPLPFMAGMNVAQAALRNWVHNLHNTLGEKGIQAATVSISVVIAEQSPEGYPHRAADDIATTYWDLHTHRDQIEHAINP
ncbi:SDR family oxidoreductase [Streptomyces sp. NPDC054770]